MKLLLLMLSAFASASAGYASYYSPYAHHVPVIGPNGVPVDTPEVQAAKASHIAAHIAARTGAYIGAPSAPFAHYGVPGIVHNALPADTPEVAAAKIQHHIDFAAAAQLNGVHVAAPVAHFAGPHPVDTPEVQSAKAAHFAAHAAALSGLHYRRRRAIYPYAQHIPVIGPNGVPVETPEVQAAKAHHFAALQEAASRAGPSYADYNGAYHGQYSAPYSGPWRYTEPAQIGPNGQPVETPEVQAVKAAHFAAHAARGNPHFAYGK